jgi:hypothetical protein
MVQPRLLFFPLFACALLPSACQERVLSVSIAGGSARITLPSGEIVRAPKERGQVDVTDGRTAQDGRTVGWLVRSIYGDVADLIPGTLVVWRAGKIVRRFPSDQVFYSWAFYAGGKQVAYHVGPLHGESKSHCELRDIDNGRVAAAWDGDLDSDSNRPEWTKGLGH